MYLVTVEFSKEILFSWNWIQKRCDSVLLCSHITSALAQCKCTVLRPDCACKFCHANHVSGEGFSVLLAGAEQGTVGEGSLSDHRVTASAFLNWKRVPRLSERWERLMQAVASFRKGEWVLRREGLFLAFVIQPIVTRQWEKPWSLAHHWE